MNPYKKAFQEPANLIGLAAVVASSFAFLQPDIAAVGAVIEAAYLLFIPTTKWYMNRLTGLSSVSSNMSDAERLAAKVATLPTDLQARYTRLVQLRTDIESKLKQQVSFPTEVVAKLDTLMTQFVDLGITQTQFITYLQSLVSAASTKGAIQSSSGQSVQYPPIAGSRTSQYYQGNNYRDAVPQQQPLDFNQLSLQATAKTEKWVQWAVGRAQSEYNDELNRLDPDSETDPALKDIKIKRVDIISRRNEHLTKLSKGILNSLMQMQLIEDTVGLIDDQVSTQSPEQVVSEIDSLMQQTDILTKSLSDVQQMYTSQGV